MKNSSSLIYNAFLIVGDLLALIAAFVGAYILRVTLDARPLIEAVPARTYLGIFLTLLPVWLIIFAMIGLYNSSIYEKRFNELGRLLVGSFIGLLFVIFWDFISDNPIFPARLVPLYGFILAFTFLVIFRNLARMLRTILFSYNVGLTNILIIGDTELARELVESLYESRFSGYRVVGYVGKKDFSVKFPSVKRYDDFTSALNELGKEEVHSIVQTELYSDEQKNQEILSYCQTHHIGYRFAPGNSELFVGNIEVELFRSSVPVIAVHQTPLFGWGRIAKRITDLIFGSTLLVLSSPIMLVIIIMQKLINPGEIIFRQKRLTRFNHEFDVYKFRTVKKHLNGLSPEEAFSKLGKPQLAKQYREQGDQLPNDPRYGAFGNFLRKSGLDELPQLFNVIKGDLSLVGPRALTKDELTKFDKHYSILSVKSGLTGLAQVSGRRNISYDERRQLDMYYVQNWSVWFDIVIIIKTIRVVLTGKL